MRTGCCGDTMQPSNAGENTSAYLQNLSSILSNLTTAKKKHFFITRQPQQQHFHLCFSTGQTTKKRPQLIQTTVTVSNDFKLLPLEMSLKVATYPTGTCEVAGQIAPLV